MNANIVKHQTKLYINDVSEFRVNQNFIFTDF